MYNVDLSLFFVFPDSSHFPSSRRLRGCCVCLMPCTRQLSSCLIQMEMEWLILVSWELKCISCDLFNSPQTWFILFYHFDWKKRGCIVCSHIFDILFCLHTATAHLFVPYPKSVAVEGGHVGGPCIIQYRTHFNQ